MKIKYYQINGEIKKSNEALISVDDYGLMRGYGIFETIRFNKDKLIKVLLTLNEVKSELI